VDGRRPDRGHGGSGGLVIEIADFTGLPVIALRAYAEYAERFPWLRDNPNGCCG
jgi:hypothetical protein